MKIKVDWQPGTVFTPPGAWYHTHFNLSSKPARQFAFHGFPFGTLRKHGVLDAYSEYNTVNYHEEDQEIRELYKRELDERGIQFQMPEECFTGPNFDFSA